MDDNFTISRFENRKGIILESGAEQSIYDVLVLYTFFRRNRGKNLHVLADEIREDSIEEVIGRIESDKMPGIAFNRANFVDYFRQLSREIAQGSTGRKIVDRHFDGTGFNPIPPAGIVSMSREGRHLFEIHPGDHNYSFEEAIAQLLQKERALVDAGFEVVVGPINCEPIRIDPYRLAGNFRFSKYDFRDILQKIRVNGFVKELIFDNTGHSHYGRFFYSGAKLGLTAGLSAKDRQDNEKPLTFRLDEDGRHIIPCSFRVFNGGQAGQDVYLHLTVKIGLPKNKKGDSYTRQPRAVAEEDIKCILGAGDSIFYLFKSYFLSPNAEKQLISPHVYP